MPERLRAASGVLTGVLTGGVAFVALTGCVWVGLQLAGREVTGAAVLPASIGRPSLLDPRPAPVATPGPESTGTAASAGAGRTGARVPAMPVPRMAGYSLRAGRIRAGCLDGRIGLQGGYAQPASGWSVRVLRSTTPTDLRVLFSSTARPTDGVIVHGYCRGAPVFEQHRVDPTRRRPAPQWQPAPAPPSSPSSPTGTPVPTGSPTADPTSPPAPSPSATLWRIGPPTTGPSPSAAGIP